MKRPAGEGQADARTGFAGAIPTKKDGSLNCEGVGATCEADKVKADENKEEKAAAAEANDEVKKEAGKILKEEAEKAAKKEKGEGPKDEVPVDEKELGKAAAPAEEKAAFSQLTHKHHHKKHHHKHH